jgi:methylamine dehydrogenase heavy chain
MKKMRVATILTLCCTFSIASAQIQPQTMSQPETMPDPGENWFMAVGRTAGYVFDASSGDMHGLISISGHTPAVQPNPARGEFYAAASFYSRGSYGDRTDVLVIHDYENLSPVAEVELPKKIVALPFRAYIGLMSGGKYVGVSNMTPAQSVSIVDVENRSFVGEISTPGCALIMPVENDGFMSLCGDGTLQLVRLGADGTESNRVRSTKFFDMQEDPVYDRPRETATGWSLLSNAGLVFDVSTNGNSINISDAWSILSEKDAEEGWLPGGSQLNSVHKDLSLLYIAMHQGEQYTHHEAGTEIWVFNTTTQRRLARIELEIPSATLMVTQEAEPLLIVGNDEGEVNVYDALTFVHQRSIEAPEIALFEDL